MRLHQQDDPRSVRPAILLAFAATVSLVGWLLFQPSQPVESDKAETITVAPSPGSISWQWPPGTLATQKSDDRSDESRASLERNLLGVEPSVDSLHDALNRTVQNPGSAPLVAKLRQQILNLSADGVSAARPSVRCGPAFCEVSGAVVQGTVPATQESAFGLIHGGRLASASEAEGLTLGPTVIAPVSQNQMGFVAYFIRQRR